MLKTYRLRFLSKLRQHKVTKYIRAKKINEIQNLRMLNYRDLILDEEVARNVLKLDTVLDLNSRTAFDLNSSKYLN